MKFSGSNDPARIIRVQMTIERERLPSITDDSIAQISNDTFIGDKFVDITTGKAAGHIPENGEMRFKAQPDLMRSIDMSDFERQLRALDDTLADIEHGRSPFGQFIVGDQVYAPWAGDSRSCRVRSRKPMQPMGDRRSDLHGRALPKS